MAAAQLALDAPLLLEQLRALGAVGHDTAQSGRTRIALTDDEKAGHDARMMVRIAPFAMIFVPSRGGISHNPREHTDDAQLIQGAQVLLDVVQDCLATR